MVATFGWRGKDPNEMLIVPTDTVVRVAANEDNTVFVTTTGRIYIGTYNGVDRGTLKQIDVGTRRICDAAIYRGQIFFVTDRGDVFTYNIVSGDVKSFSILKPKKTCSHGLEERGKKVRVHSVRAGIDHILFLSHEHEVWVQGKGAALGLFTNKTEHEVTNPIRLDFFKGRRILQVEAGDLFTVALVEGLSSSAGDPSGDPLSDFDAYVRTCEQCRHETGDRVLFDDQDCVEKCPLGLGVLRECGARDLLSPAPSSTGNADGQSSRNSQPHEDGESSDCVADDTDYVESPKRVQKTSEGSEFEVLATGCSDSESKPTGLFVNADAARQFITRQLSWMTTSTDSPTTSEKSHNKYPAIDSATEMIKGNMNSAASLVASGVRSVSNRVGLLSRHFSSGDCAVLDQDSILDSNADSFNTEFNSMQMISHMGKSDSFEGHIRVVAEMLHPTPRKHSHLRTGSGSFNFVKNSEDGSSLISNRSPVDIEKNKKALLQAGWNILNTEVWSWGSSSNCQLGMGDLSNHSTPIKVLSMNHSSVVKVVCGSHHTAALTDDGQVYLSFPAIDKDLDECDHSKIHKNRHWKVFSWGDSCLSLSSNTMSSSTIPRTVLLPQAKRARDLASGSDFLIVVSLDGAVYYIGRLREREADEIKAMELSIAEPGTKFTSALCQHETVVCTSDAENCVVNQFLEKEMEYLSLLRETVQHVVKPFLATCNNVPNQKLAAKDSGSTGSNSSSGCSSISNNTAGHSSAEIGSQIHKVKQALLESFLDLTHLVAAGVSELRFSPSSDVLSSLPIVKLSEEYQLIYRQYLVFICDAIAVSGLSLTTKEASAIMEKCQTTMAHWVPEIQRKTLADLFAYLLLRPMERIHDYDVYLGVLKEDTSNYYSPFTLDKLNMAHSMWKLLVSEARKSKDEANLTKAFWDLAPTKLSESLCHPSRRLLCESRIHQINVNNASRFSSHAFVLFTDVLLHQQYSTFAAYALSTMWVESIANTPLLQSGLKISMPEDTITLVCSNGADKTLWLNALQESIKRSVLSPREVATLKANPLVRTATYTFTKLPLYKDATYTGQWFCGKLHGQGTMTWIDGRRYQGHFNSGLYHGPGRLETPSGAGVTVYEGVWKNGKLEGKGEIRFANKDVYTGYLKDNLPHGHGELKKGRFSSQAASVYTGEWVGGVKQGYGVLDEIVKGEKYLGMWQNNNRHGCGMVVTMHGIYYEGNFYNNKLMGFGLLIFEDGAFYEGEMGNGGSLAGKGTMHYPNGDLIDGTFTGGWEEGVKINGTLHRNICSVGSIEESPVIKLYGTLSVPASQKWCAIFRHYEEQLGITSTSAVSTEKIWESLASRIETEKRVAQRLNNSFELDGLDLIPDRKSLLTYESFMNIHLYLGKAFESPIHPLGKLLQCLVDAFRATYSGVVAHPRLLQYAVQEVQSFTSRLYQLVRLLFPELPLEGEVVELLANKEDQEEIVITPAYVIHPCLLLHMYSPLSMLYVLYHQRSDEEYWRRLLKWNRQSDIALMTFLGVDMKFWLPENISIVECSQSLGTLKDHHFIEAIETLQMLSTSFSPRDKLALIHRTFELINKAVIIKLGTNYQWSMDDLFPVFQYVVVRSRIQHLGAEIQLIEDLLDVHLQHGELGIMFTTLQACYQQIQNEKLHNML